MYVILTAWVNELQYSLPIAIFIRQLNREPPARPSQYSIIKCQFFIFWDDTVQDGFEKFATFAAITDGPSQVF